MKFYFYICPFSKQHSKFSNIFDLFYKKYYTILFIIYFYLSDMNYDF